MRLKYAYIICCNEVIKDPVTGEITELHCTYDPLSKSGGPNAGRKIKGTLHWVEATQALDAEVRMHDLLLKENEGETEGDFLEQFNPQSQVILTGCKVEPSLKSAKGGDKFQFLRNGYFCTDSRYSTAEHLVFNHTVSLKDSYKPE